MIRFLATLCACLLSASCSSTKTVVSAPIDLHDKTIAMSTGGGDFSMTVKMMLRKHGWRILARQGLEITPGSGRSFNGERGTFARYSLHASGSQVDRSFRGRPVYSYEMSVVDNKTGEEVVILHGNDDADGAAVQLIEALEGEGVAES